MKNFLAGLGIVLVCTFVASLVYDETLTITPDETDLLARLNVEQVLEDLRQDNLRLRIFRSRSVNPGKPVHEGSFASVSPIWRNHMMIRRDSGDVQQSLSRGCFRRSEYVRITHLSGDRILVVTNDRELDKDQVATVQAVAAKHTTAKKTEKETREEIERLVDRALEEAQERGEVFTAWPTAYAEVKNGMLKTVTPHGRIKSVSLLEETTKVGKDGRLHVLSSYLLGYVTEDGQSWTVRSIRQEDGSWKFQLPVNTIRK